MSPVSPDQCSPFPSSRRRPPAARRHDRNDTFTVHQRHGDRGSGEDASAPLGVLPTFVRFADLVAARIVTNWPTLLRLIETEDFPAGVMLGPNMRAWRADLVAAWLDQRPTGRKPIPEATRRAVSAAKRRRRIVKHEEAEAG
jgi:predicted DNA-binding transcriptional regulator AlpA